MRNMAREKLVYFCLFSLKIWVIVRLLSIFLGKTGGNLAIFIRHISRAKVSNRSLPYYNSSENYIMDFLYSN